MPKLREQLATAGTEFSQAFATTSQCCPSRASMLTGKYAHNHTVYDNHETLGGAEKFRSSGEEESTIATWLDDEGYETILVGKYLNWYDGTYIPPGWDEWRGQMGRNNNHRYNINGTIKYFDPNVYHDTDLFSGWATEYIREGVGKTEPFFMYLSVNAPHGPAIPAARHATAFSEEELPRPPSFNEADVSDKPSRVSSLPLLTDEQVASMTEKYRDRLRSMLSVDDMIEQLVYELGQTGELDNTYIVFTSDHGYHMGQHRMLPGKTRVYEEDIDIPLYVRGPGVPAGQTLEHKVLNMDFAPTFARLGGAQAPTGTDGRSFVSLLGAEPPPVDPWRESFLVEFFRPAVTSPQYTDAFSALRTGEYTYVEHDNGERELYDLLADPHQLESLHASAEHQGTIDGLRNHLQVLKSCSGAGCRAADGGTLLAKPTGLTVALSPSGVSLDWEDHPQEDLAGYNVYRASAEAGPFTMLNAEPLSASGYEDAEAPVGRLSYYLVAAVDGDGNESAPAVESVNIPDTTPPETTIDSGPEGPTNDARPAFSFSASDDGSSGAELLYSHRVDEGEWSAYSTDTTAAPGGEAGLAEGPHVFSVRARDAAGNEDGSPAQRTFTVDTTPPDTGIDRLPRGTSRTNSATLAFSSTEPDSTFECSFDGARYAACFSPKEYTDLTEGLHALRVRSTDAAGNADSTPARRAWTVDTVKPSGTVSIDEENPSTSAQTVILTLSADDPEPASGVVWMRFKNDETTTWSSWEAYSSSKEWTLSEGAGTKTVYAQFRDRVGNSSAQVSDGIAYEP